MSRSDLDKLRERLALVAYFRDRFGVTDPDDPASVRQYYEELDRQDEGYDERGRSGVVEFVQFKADVADADAEVAGALTTEELRRYDENVRRHTEALNQRRSDPIVLKPFQVLAGLMTEAYLDRLFNRREAFLDDLNAFVAARNETKGRIKFPEFADDDLDKLAFWMATGSGKTLLMHLNYYQYVHYAANADTDALPENILLVTPNEGLSAQHIEDLRESSIPCHRFDAETPSLQDVGENPVKVIEITKLVEDKTDEGIRVEVDSFGTNNLVLVDEGHKGTGVDQTWGALRERLAEDGFTFEYSATFGQALSNSSATVEKEYGKSVLFDYSNPRFYDDGYGKDYRIVNLESEIDTDLRDRYLLANLLTYYEQIHVFNRDPETIRNTYNIEFPLLVFIGHTVNAATKSEVGAADDRTLADVEKALLFMSRVLRNEGDWVPEAIDQVLDGDAGLTGEGPVDPFGDALDALRESGLDGEAVYERLRREVFHVESSSGLDLVNIQNAAGEIGLRASGTDEYFGLINIGADRVFLDRVGGEHDRIDVETDQFQHSLFRTINSRDSTINVLLGSRKFIEGWDSWRVSAMGLMNFGRGEGSQVIQLFGRGVRLLGKDRSLKRSSVLDVNPPANLSALETLNVFGVRADYMAKFRDYLAEEGIDTEPREVVEIPTRTQEHFVDEGLLVVRPDPEAVFTEEVSLELEATDDRTPTVDVMQIERLSPGEDTATESKTRRTIPSAYLDLLDWHEIYKQVWQFRREEGYENLICEKATLRAVLAKECYTLYCPEDMLEVTDRSDLDRLQRLAVMVLRTYVRAFYTDEEKQWEQSQLSYVPITEERDREQGNFFEEYMLAVKTSAEEFLEELHEAVGTESLYATDEGIPSRVHFDRHLYLPLLANEFGDDTDTIEYSPAPLNEGEQRFVENVKEYFVSGAGAELLDSWDVYLLRNQSRGRGVGLLSDGERTFPDFIMWLQADDRQHVVFFEPHGMKHGGEPVTNHRVTLHDNIKTYETELSERTKADYVSLHSYVVSQTDLNALREMSDIASTEEEFRDAGLYLPDTINPMLADVLSGETRE